MSAPPGLTIFQYDAKMPTSVQWNTGLQFTLPWASVMDVEYVGNHSYNLLEQTDINAPDFGAAYLPQNQNPDARGQSARGGERAADELLPAVPGIRRDQPAT